MPQRSFPEALHKLTTLDDDAHTPGRFYFPDTMAAWPWPRTINSHFEEVKVASDTWFRNFKAFSPQSQKSFDRCDFDRFGALAYPRASKEHLRTACDLIKVFFVIDEYTDVENATATREMVEVVLDALKNPYTPRPPHRGRVAELLEGSGPWLSRRLVPHQCHFLKEFAAWLYSLVTQAADRAQGVCRSINGYLAVRRDNIATRPSFMGLEGLAG
ncbi:terpenoid synthase [Leucogyrophana mollusca]|uniref:Terpenoid synthase n=1 Tax=Leucogyrophana mollusca TaxID=85980 RepID=A0ACB8BY52_9AGAM|nr:terpenoid synthase [Leucogyrophana mollusca]